MGTTKQMIGTAGMHAGDSSVLCAFVPSVRRRTRRTANVALADLSPDSAPWRPPVV
jgi:hypothetical protein